MGNSVEITQARELTPDEVAGVLGLARAANDEDGTYPLSEHVTLRLSVGSATSLHLMAHADGALVGYAQVDPAGFPSAELCVDPSHRGRGIGRALLHAARAAAGECDSKHGFRVWAHGDLPAASALATSLGLRRVRVLWQFRRSLLDPLPRVVLPEGVALRAFRPGADDEAWLALNARIFAGHPEQGRWTMADLHARMRKESFDPAGFLLAVRTGDGALLGFDWTKTHPIAGEAIGEVYVLGVDPDAHRSGLGTALALAGLSYLRAHGQRRAMLYVDEENKSAVRLYERLGFARFSRDVCYGTGPASGPSAGRADG